MSDEGLSIFDEKSEGAAPPNPAAAGEKKAARPNPDAEKTQVIPAVPKGGPAPQPPQRAAATPPAPR
ncbi:MAG: hypothetical protein WB767_05105, partial [Nocardioides sp.]